MKVIIIVFLTFFLKNSALSQKSGNNEDVYYKFFTKTETPPTFSDNLSNYIDSVLSGSALPNKGRVIIEIIIDSVGIPHYKNLYDNTSGDVSNLDLQQVVDNMPPWTPAFQNGHPVNFILIFLLDFSHRKLVQISVKSMDDKWRYMLNSNKP